MHTSTKQLEWQGIHLWRGDRCLQSDLSGTLRAGQAITLRGPNGCGKTTLLRTLVGLTLPERGEISWDGQPLHLSRSDLYSQLAYSGHANGLKSDLSPLENLQFSQRLHARTGDPTHALTALGLSRCAKLPVRELSAGQKRRAALASVIGSGARIWVLDEPFTNVDTEGCSWLSGEFNRHLAQDGMLLLAAHQPTHIEADREMLLELEEAN